MGSPSYVISQEITLKADIDFKKIIEKNNKIQKPYWEYVNYVGNDIELVLDELKIIQYWYPDFREFLKEIAKYIKEGSIYLSCDDFGEYAYIMFKDGKVWVELKPNDFIKYELEDM